MSDTVATTQIRVQTATEQWARLTADTHAEIVLMHSGNEDPEHRAKVREAQERALARGSDFI